MARRGLYSVYPRKWASFTNPLLQRSVTSGAQRVFTGLLFDTFQAVSAWSGSASFGALFQTTSAWTGSASFGAVFKTTMAWTGIGTFNAIYLPPVVAVGDPAARRRRRDCF